jgi:hypothetical protein
MSVFMTQSLYGTRGRSEPAIAGSAGLLVVAYPVNFGSAVTATAAADADPAEAAETLVGRSPWTPPTSIGGSSDVGGVSLQTLLTSVVSLFPPPSTFQSAKAAMSRGPVALVKSEIVTLTVPDEPVRFVFFVLVVPFTVIWNVISDGPCGKSFSSTDALLQSTFGGPLAT